MKQFLVPVIMVKQTYGHISVMAESMDKAKAIVLTQEQMAFMFQNHHVEDVHFEIESNINTQTVDNCFLFNKIKI